MRLRFIPIWAAQALLAAFCGAVVLAQETGAAAPRTDSEIEMDVVHGLNASPTLKNGLITAATIQGEVTLSGTVSSESSRQLAQSIAAQVPGVAKVNNNLQVGNPHQTSSTDQRPPRQSIEGSIFRVWLDTDVWTQGNLIKQLNKQGESKHIQFIAVTSDESYDYHVQYDPSTQFIPLATGGGITAHSSSVTVTDPSGRVMFQLDLGGAFTVKGESNYAAKKIIKLLIETWGK
jgi:hypothetical protein